MNSLRAIEDKLNDLDYDFENCKNEGEFKNQMNKADLESLLESMGHDFIDLDELSEEEKEKYY